MSDIIDIPQAEEPAQTQALTVHQPMPLAEVPKTTTPTQARVDAVANLTFKAYERASTLTLTPEQVTALQADFPDEAFRRGASGKEDLIYIEHAHLRDRLNQVFGPGQWAIIPRSRWAEDYEYFKNGKAEKASRVYVEAMLVVHGAFVAEAIGDMVYYPANQSTNYGDAVEGAKTAALRRCAKELGVGLQAWKKDFCEGWKRRQSMPQRPQPQPVRQAQAPVATPAPTPQPEVKPDPKAPTPATRTWMLEKLCGKDGESRDEIKGYFEAIGALKPEQVLEDLPLEYVVTSKPALKELMAAVLAFTMGEAAVNPFKKEAK